MLAPSVLSYSAEFTQNFLPGRHPSLKDWLLNSLGAFAVGLFVNWKEKHHPHDPNRLDEMPGEVEERPREKAKAPKEPAAPKGKGKPLSGEEIGLVRAWIDQGAKWPEDLAVAAASANHWSLKPIARPGPPQLQSADWRMQNAIDSFIATKLKENGIEPSPAADKTTLLRRLHLDLIGLLPTPENVGEFVDDQHPDAVERLVDRLLASPHFCERWGRHWLDLARYADSDGYEKDRPRPFAFRYRDWVIAALNADMPFDQFTIEQLAGDFAGKVRIGKLNTDDNPQVASSYGISAIPTVLLFKGGNIVERFVGVTPKGKMSDSLTSHL